MSSLVMQVETKQAIQKLKGNMAAGKERSCQSRRVELVHESVAGYWRKAIKK